MPTDIAEMIAALLMVFLIGTFILLFPLSRRLGKVMEEWIQLRHDSSPDRGRLERIEDGLRLIRSEGGLHAHRDRRASGFPGITHGVASEGFADGRPG